MNEFIKELENKMVISTNFIWKFHMDLNAMLKDYDNNINEILQTLYGVSPPNRSKTLIRNFSPVQELGIKDFLAVFS